MPGGSSSSAAAAAAAAVPSSSEVGPSPSFLATLASRAAALSEQQRHYDDGQSMFYDGGGGDDDDDDDMLTSPDFGLHQGSSDLYSHSHHYSHSHPSQAPSSSSSLPPGEKERQSALTSALYRDSLLRLYCPPLPSLSSSHSPSPSPSPSPPPPDAVSNLRAAALAVVEGVEAWRRALQSAAADSSSSTSHAQVHLADSSLPSLVRPVITSTTTTTTTSLVPRPGCSPPPPLLLVNGLDYLSSMLSSPLPLSAARLSADKFPLARNPFLLPLTVDTLVGRPSSGIVGMSEVAELAATARARRHCRRRRRRGLGQGGDAVWLCGG